MCPVSGAGEQPAGEVFSVERCPREGVLEALHTCKERAVIMYLQQRCSDITELAEKASAVATGANMKWDTVYPFLCRCVRCVFCAFRPKSAFYSPGTYFFPS